MTKPTLNARAELAWLDSSFCRSLADSACEMPDTFAQTYIAQHYPAPVSPIPEPSTASLALAGLAVVAYLSRRHA